MTQQDLVTAQSLAMSLAPPRSPPLGSAHRYLLCNKDPSQGFLTHHHHHHEVDQNESHYSSKRRNISVANVQRHHGLRQRVGRLLQEIHWKNSMRLPHPHISVAPDSGDQITRCIGSILSISLQHKYRDDGTFRSVSDTLVKVSVPSLALIHRGDARRFLELTNRKVTLSYGKHKSQIIDIFIPSAGIHASRGFVFFVHGGAWGSGMPWMYRLCAFPFLNDNYVVAIVGYRTYPDGNVQDQVNDLEAASKALVSTYPELKTKCGKSNDDWRGNTIIGHSSGAHISLLMLVQRIEKAVSGDMSGDTAESSSSSYLQFDQYIGLSGVYSISHHFDYEAGRGVEELSPMKPACGFTRESFDHYSPAILLKILCHTFNRRHVGSHGDCTVDDIIAKYMPKVLLLHGVDDTTVPFTSTSEAAKILRSCGVCHCHEYYTVCGHADIVMQLMLGGETREIVMKWLNDEEPRLVDRVFPSKL
mmetsp:Transcript_14134/g.26511  ORF Transcript_14134/g.26511 Transcript_14134/m.26511 type:complete len:474 (-) Transcript_14134:1587-3008(-)